MSIPTGTAVMPANYGLNRTDTIADIVPSTEDRFVLVNVIGAGGVALDDGDISHVYDLTVQLAMGALGKPVKGWDYASRWIGRQRRWCVRRDRA